MRCFVYLVCLTVALTNMGCQQDTMQTNKQSSSISDATIATEKPVTPERPDDSDANQPSEPAPVKHLFVAKLLLKRFEAIELSDQQMSEFNRMSADLRSRVDKMREEAGITPELIKQRDEVFSKLKKTDLKGDGLWAELQKKMQVSDEKRDAFRSTHEQNKKFRKEAIKLLTKEQHEKIGK